MPVTTPVDEPTVATPVLLLAQVPPVGEPISRSTSPVHILDTGTPALPEIITGVGFTVTFVVIKQPPGNV
jgi:hypothetical protein